MENSTVDTSISHRVILIRIPVLYRPDMNATELYEATRGVWALNGRRARRAEYVFAVTDQRVREVYKPDRWEPAGSTPYQFRSQDAMRRPGRWEFLGALADSETRERYRGLSLAGMFRPGASNPIMYVNM
jgi:uncharacterized protein